MKELQNTATNHSADIDYKDFMNIQRRCTNEPHFFFNIGTTLPASNSLRFRKNLLYFIIKMTLLMKLKFLMTRLNQIKLSTNQTEKQQKFLHNHLVNLNISQVKMWDISQEQLEKLNLNILHWLKFLKEDQKKKIKKKDSKI